MIECTRHVPRYSTNILQNDIFKDSTSRFRDAASLSGVPPADHRQRSRLNTWHCVVSSNIIQPTPLHSTNTSTTVHCTGTNNYLFYVNVKSLQNNRSSTFTHQCFCSLIISHLVYHSTIYLQPQTRAGFEILSEIRDSSTFSYQARIGEQQKSSAHTIR